MKALVIGSGISGLTAGAYLAGAGHKVIVFEQEKYIGGVTATIEQNGFKWDLGPLLIEKLDEGQELGDILKELGIAGEISTIRSDRGIVFPDFELWAPERYEGKNWRKEKLKNLFPGDAKGIDKYYRFYEHMTAIIFASNKIRKKERVAINKLQLMAHFLMVKKYQDMSARELTEAFFSDERLRAVFTGILADFCVLPGEFPALGVPLSNIETAFDQRIGDHFDKYMVYNYVEGGTGSLCKALAKCIEGNGGEIKTCTAVKSVLVEKGAAVGLETAGGEEYEADIIIASGGMKETFYDLIGKENVDAGLVNQIEDLVPMESVLMVHLGLDIDPMVHQRAPLCYYYLTYDISRAVEDLRSGLFDGGSDGFLIYVPSAHSKSMAPEGMHSVTIYTVAPNVLKQGSWEKDGDALADALIKHAEEYIPGLSGHIVEKVVMTPLEFKKLTHLKHHGFGGISPIMGKTNPPHKTPVKNFYFIGAQSESGGGVGGAMNGAAKTAKKILEQSEKNKGELR